MSSAANDLAARLIDGGEAAPVLADDERLALAWALKDACYAAWNSAPQRAASAAEALATLRGGAAEIDALADWTAGIAHLTRGQMAEAVGRLDAAAARFRQLGAAGPAAQTQVPKIVALAMLGQHRQAVESAESTQRAFVALGDWHAASKVSLNLGSLQLRHGAYADAARHYREAAVLFARAGDREHSVMADVGLADALTSLGDFDEALRIYARAQMRAEHHGLPVLRAIVDESVALLELARGRYREALAGFESARGRYEALAMPQHLAIAEKQLADAYLELRMLPEALALFDPALERFVALAMPEEEAWTLAQRGRALALLGQPAAAEASLARAARLFGGEGHALGAAAVALVRAELADDPAAALALAQEAAAGYRAAGGVDGLARAEVLAAHALLRSGRHAEARTAFATTLALARRLQLLSVQVRCLTGLGLAAQARHDDAGARSRFEAAVAQFEDQRRALPGDEIRSAFLTDHLRPYRELLRLALRAHDAAPSEGAAAQVLRQFERFRARSLGERLREPGGDGAANDDGELRTRLNWLYRRTLQLDGEAQPAPELSADLGAELRRSERELLERARRGRLGAGAQAADAHEDLLDPAALQAELGDGDALLAYGLLDDELFAAVVTRAGVRLARRIADAAAVTRAVRAARFQLEALRHGAGLLAPHLPALTARVEARLADLHRLIWQPLAGPLEGCRRIIVVAPAELGTLPFAALHGGDGVLAQRIALAMAPSARVALRGLQRRPVAARHALVLGESSQLPQAAQEAGFVASLFPSAQLAVDADATVALLREHAAEADVLHLACHAQFRSDNPSFSALHLHDAALTAEWAESLALRPGLVVLSGCETGLADIDGGDETFGLVRAFLVAGAARVLASLWPVQDEVTALFMSHFYRALCHGAGPAAALQAAQCAVMLQHPHPSHWAAFALHGGW